MLLQSQIDAIDKIDWQMRTPDEVIQLVKQLFIQSSVFKDKITQLHCYHQRSFFQTDTELQQVLLSKVNIKQLELYLNSFNKFYQDLLQKSQSKMQTFTQQFKDLLQKDDTIEIMNTRLPEARQQIRVVAQDALTPAINSQSRTLTEMGHCQIRAKECSNQIYKLVRDFKENVQINVSKKQKVNAQVKTSLNDLNSTSEYYKKLFSKLQNDLQQITIQMESKQLKQINEMQNVVVKEMKNDTLQIISGFSLAEIDFKKDLLIELDQQSKLLEEQVNSFVDGQNKDFRQLKQDVHDKLNKFKLNLSLEIENMHEQQNINLKQQEQVIEQNFNKSNKLQQIEQNINQVQKEWTNDVQYFKQKYVEGSLQEAQIQIQNQFDFQFKEDSAGILKQSQQQLTSVQNQIGIWKDFQNQRKIQFEQDRSFTEETLRKVHGLGLSEANQRVDQLRQLQQHFIINFDNILQQIDQSIENYEFAELVELKLDKAEVDVAFSVTCPAEQYNNDKYIDVSKLNKQRLGTTQLNIPSNIQDMNVSGKFISTEWVKNDALLLKVEEQMNNLGFGVSTKDKKKQDEKSQINNQKRQEQRVKSARRAYHNRDKWKAISLDDYLNQFETNFGKM